MEGRRTKFAINCGPNTVCSTGAICPGECYFPRRGRRSASPGAQFPALVGGGRRGTGDHGPLRIQLTGPGVVVGLIGPDRAQTLRGRACRGCDRPYVARRGPAIFRQTARATSPWSISNPYEAVRGSDWVRLHHHGGVWRPRAASTSWPTCQARTRSAAPAHHQPHSTITGSSPRQERSSTIG